MRSDVEMESEEIASPSKNKIDSSVAQVKSQISNSLIREKNLVIKDLSKKYTTTNGREEYTALKPFSLWIEPN